MLNTSPPPPPIFVKFNLIKLVFTGLLALLLVACSSGSSDSSDAPAAKPTITFDFSSPTITVEYNPRLTTKNNITSNINLGQLRYESDTTSVATVNSSGALSIKGVGTATIKVTRSADNQSAKELTAQFLLRVIKGNQILTFAKNPFIVGYEANKKITNTITKNLGTDAISYSIDNTSVATINTTNGELTLHSTGTATVTANKAGNANYNDFSTSYILMVNNKKNQPDFGFTPSSITTTYAVGSTVSNIATGGTGTGVISYESDNENVATVNTTNGLVTIIGAGTATITATKAGDNIYNPTENSYILTVNKATQTNFKFTQPSITITYESDATTNNLAIGDLGTGALSYSIDNTGVAMIDTTSGKVTLQGAGTATVTATKAGDSNHNLATITYTLTVLKGEQKGFRFNQDSIAVKYTTGATRTNAAIGDLGTGALSYSIDKTGVATINSTSGEVTLQGLGTATITAVKAGDDNYNPATITYTLEVNNKEDQTAFYFTQGSITITYEPDGSTSNIAKGGTGTGSITYSIDDTSVATVNSTSGKVMIIGVGKARITATKAGDATYNFIKASYDLEVTKAQQASLRFAPSSITITYAVDASTSNVARGGSSGAGLIIRYQSDNQKVATVNSTSGKVMIIGAGKAVITATRAGGRNYDDVSTTYLLTVKKAQQTGFRFTTKSITIAYEASATTSNDIAQKGESAGAITYSIENTSVATIDKNTGEVTLQGAGTTTITATQAGDANYNTATTTYNLEVNKGEQSSFSFAQDAVTIAYEASRTTSNIVTKGESAGAITYSIDNTSVATIDENTGEVTLQGAGATTITATQAGDTNYNPATATYTLRVNKGEQTGFSFAQNPVTITYEASATATYIATGGLGTGTTITYSIDNTKVATIDKNTGEVTLQGLGTATSQQPKQVTLTIKRQQPATHSSLVIKRFKQALALPKMQSP